MENHINSRRGLKLKKLEFALLSILKSIENEYSKLQLLLDSFPDAVTVDRGDSIPRLRNDTESIVEDALRDIERLK